MFKRSILQPGYLQVPERYWHDGCILDFCRRRKKECTFAPEISDSNFSERGERPVPGGNYNIVLFELTQPVNTGQIIQHLASDPVVFLGLHGLLLMFDQFSSILSRDRRYLAPVPKEKTFTMQNVPRTPFLNMESGSAKHGFATGIYFAPWRLGDTVVLFVKMSR